MLGPKEDDEDSAPFFVGRMRMRVHPLLCVRACVCVCDIDTDEQEAADAFLPVGTILPKRVTDEDGDQLPGAARCVARNISKEDTQFCNCLLTIILVYINDLNYAYQTH